MISEESEQSKKQRSCNQYKYGQYSHWLDFDSYADSLLFFADHYRQRGNEYKF